MKRLLVALLVVSCGFGGVAVWAHWRTRALLWPEAKYTVQDRDRSIEAGVRFIYSIASDPAVFRENGSDLLFAFHNIATTNANRRLAELAWSMGHERALEWRRLHPQIPPNAGISTVTDFIFGSDAANRLGVPNRVLDEALRKQAMRFSPPEYLGFDPEHEPPPSDVPKPCRVCGLQNARGIRVCIRCKTKLSMYSRQAVFQDALVTTYSGELFGASLGGHYADVLRWLPQMRPYPPHQHEAWDYYDAVYAITHVVYTFNHYNLSKVAPECFPDEFEYLKSNLSAAIRDHDPEMLGEYGDSLRAFGMTYSDARLREAVEYLLSTQNRDGSWGDPSDKDPYDRYHTTWTVLAAIQDFRWTQVLTCPEKPPSQ